MICFAMFGIEELFLASISQVNALENRYYF